MISVLSLEKDSEQKSMALRIAFERHRLRCVDRHLNGVRFLLRCLVRVMRFGTRFSHNGFVGEMFVHLMKCFLDRFIELLREKSCFSITRILCVCVFT